MSTNPIDNLQLFYSKVDDRAFQRIDLRVSTMLLLIVLSVETKASPKLDMV